MNTINSKLVYRNDEVTNFLAISQSTLDRLVKSGKIKRIKLSNQAVGYRKQDVQKFLDNCKEVGNE